QEAKVGWQSFGDRAPGVAVVIAAQHADVGPPPARTIPFSPAPVVLHVKPAGGILVAGDLVDALAELRERIGGKPGTGAFVRRRKRRAAVFAQIMAAGRDAEMHPISVAQDRVHA